MKKVLCVCTGNVCRSPMLEALLRREFEKEGITDCVVESAGTVTDDGMIPTTQAITAMQEIGIDISEHSSRQITNEIVDSTDIFVALTTEHGVALAFYYGADPERILVPGGGIADPFGYPLGAYRECRDDLLEALPELMENIKALWA